MHSILECKFLRRRRRRAAIIALLIILLSSYTITLIPRACCVVFTLSSLCVVVVIKIVLPAVIIPINLTCWHAVVARSGCLQLHQLFVSIIFLVIFTKIRRTACNLWGIPRIISHRYFSRRFITRFPRNPVNLWKLFLCNCSCWILRRNRNGWCIIKLIIKIIVIPCRSCSSCSCCCWWHWLLLMLGSHCLILTDLLFILRLASNIIFLC